MADFFDELGSAVKRVASTVSSEVTVAAREQKVREAFQTLGRLYYQSAKAGESTDGEKFREQVERIEALLREINELRANQKIPHNE